MMFVQKKHPSFETSKRDEHLEVGPLTRTLSSGETASIGNREPRDTEPSKVKPSHPCAALVDARAAHGCVTVASMMSG